MEFPAIRPQCKAGIAANFLHCRLGKDTDACSATLLFEHRDNLASRAVAKKLAECLFVIRNLVLLNQRDEVSRLVTCQRRFGEVRIGREEVFGAAMNVGEVAASAAGDQYLFSDALRALNQGDTSAALPRFDGAHKAR